MGTTELLELIEKLPADKKKEVEDFVGFLVAKTNTSLPGFLKNGIKPGFGGGKGIIAYMSDDFDEPLDDFKDYM